MSHFTNYAENKLIDALLRAQALGAPATLYFAMLKTTHGPRANSTAYSVGNTISVTCNDGIKRLYKCTTAGTTAASQSTLYPGVDNEVITDNTAVFTEQTAGLDSGSEMSEPSGGGYTRVSVTAALTAFSGTQSTGSTTVSSGTSGRSSNNATITFPSPSANWGFIWGVAIFDAASGGNPWMYGPLGTEKTVNNGDPAPTIQADAFALNL